MIRKLNKAAILAILLSFVLSAAGCKTNAPLHSSKETTKTPPQSHTPVFMLEQLPEIGEYVDDVMYTRRYPEFRDTLTPGEDYGKLIPYVGSFRDFHLVDYETGQWTNHTLSMEKYGLMTTTGEIIVDAVYDGYSINECSDGDYILTLYQSGEDYETVGRQLLCNSTGTWVTETDRNVYFNFSAWDNGLVIVSDYSQVDYSSQTGGPKVAFYDKEGNYVFGFDNCVAGNFDGFCNGYIILDFFTDFFDYEYTSRFVDKNGNIAFPQVSPRDGFSDGKAPVQDSSGLYGLMSTDGSWVIDPIYEDLYRQEDFYIASEGLNKIVLDSFGAQIASVAGDVGIYGGRIYSETSEYDEEHSTFRYQFTDALTNEIFICRETGEPVTQHFFDTDYFYCDDGTDTYIVDHSGNTLAKLTGVGNLNKIDDDYFYLLQGSWADYSQLYSLYSFQGFQKLWSQKKTNFGSSVYLHDDSGYIIKSHVPLLGGLGAIPNYIHDILDIKTGEPVFEDLTNYTLFSLDGNSYLFFSDTHYTYGYDQDMHLLIKIRNQATD